jgi:[CysO sulfur-carrier protein]-S-L-cysteine hydrolase
MVERRQMIEIPADVRDAMVAHAFAGLPEEACGLLGGRNDDGVARAEHFFPMSNADHSHLTYRLDGREQLQVFNEIEEKGWSLVGIFHSHTHTEAYPSATDRTQAFYPDAHYVLVSLQDGDIPQLRAYTIRDGLVREEAVTVV